MSERAEFSRRPKSLKEYYDLIVSLSPSASHSESDFLVSIAEQLARDPIRNSSLQRNLSEKSMSLEFQSSWPLNDFNYATEKYLHKIGLSEDGAVKVYTVIREL